MAELLMILEYLVTAPGRLMVWFRWAMPGNADHHDAAFRDSRLWHWVFSGFFYFGLWRVIDLGMRDGLFERIQANWAAFAPR